MPIHKDYVLVIYYFPHLMGTFFNEPYQMTPRKHFCPRSR